MFMGLGKYLINTLSNVPRVRKEYAEWGRVLDRNNKSWSGMTSYANPDPIDSGSIGDRYFRASVNPHVKAGLLYSDPSRLFISARGLEPDEFGAYHPPQLGYTSPDEGDEEQLESLAYQYDEKFDGGFQPILKSLLDPALQYGRSIGEISWQRDGNSFYADFIWSRDPQEFVFSPPNLPSGLYRKKHTYSTALSSDLIKMPPGKFMFIVHDPLFNNPYGQSLLRPIIELIETWQGTGTGYDDDIDKKGVFSSWREGMKKAGFGWVFGEYDQTIDGDDNRSKSAREKFLDSLKRAGQSVAAIFPFYAKVRTEKIDMDSQAFLDFFTMYVQTISILLCGSATALIEGKYGSYAKEESTTVREKSIREQINASMLSLAFTYQFNRFWLHYNYGQAAKVIPQLQLIPPDRIMPTTPQGQDKADDTDDTDDTDEIETHSDEKIEEKKDEEVQEFRSGEIEEEKKTLNFPPFLTM